MKTKAEIMLETITYYGEDPTRRGIKVTSALTFDNESKEMVPSTHESCQYVVRNGETKYCAIGRVLTDGGKEFAKEVFGDVKELAQEQWIFAYDGNVEYDSPNHDYDYYLDELLQDEYRGYEVEFWQDLQSLHDDPKHWSNNKDFWLTVIGWHAVVDLAHKHLKEGTDEYNLFSIQIGSRSETS